MIQLKITSDNADTIEQIASLLLRNKLAIDINLAAPAQRMVLMDEQVKKAHIYTLTAKTKALLFNKIESLLKMTYQEICPELYSLPITTMEQTQAEQLIQFTQKV